MNLHLHWINLLILFGAVQALIFSIILLFNKTHPGSKFLSIFIFVLAYNGFETFNWSSGLDQHYLFFDMFGYVVIYALGPSLFFYVSSLLNPDHKFSRKDIVRHFGFVIFQFVARIAIIIYHILWINKIIPGNISSNDLISIAWFAAEPLSVLIFLGYLVATIRKFSNFTRQKSVIPSLYPSAQEAVTRWIKALLVCLVIFAAIWVATIISPYFITIPFSHYYPVELVLVFFIYWMALNGYHKMKLIYLPNSRESIQGAGVRIYDSGVGVKNLRNSFDSSRGAFSVPENVTKISRDIGEPPRETVSESIETTEETIETFAEPVNAVEGPNEPFAEPVNAVEGPNEPFAEPVNAVEGPNEPFAEPVNAVEGPNRSFQVPAEKNKGSANRSELSRVQESTADHDKYFRLIKEAMEKDKLYLDPDLNLSKLSAHTAIQAKLISAVLNQYQQTNFNDFINSYRVTQVSLLMMNPSTRNLTISSLAMDAGFNSQATFQRAFKKHTGMSPRQFIARSLKRSA